MTPEGYVELFYLLVQLVELWISSGFQGETEFAHNFTVDCSSAEMYSITFLSLHAFFSEFIHSFSKYLLNLLCARRLVYRLLIRG